LLTKSKPVPDFYHPGLKVADSAFQFRNFHNTSQRVIPEFKVPNGSRTSPFVGIDTALYHIQPEHAMKRPYTPRRVVPSLADLVATKVGSGAGKTGITIDVRENVRYKLGVARIDTGRIVA